MQYKSYILTIAGVFVEQPGPESVVFAAVGTRVQFTCSVDESYSADWLWAEVLGVGPNSGADWLPNSPID